MTVESKLEKYLDLTMDPKCYWDNYEALKHDNVLAKALGNSRLEALSRLVRELSENACYHGKLTSPGTLSAHRSLLIFELRLGGPPFDSVKQAAAQNTGGLYSCDAVLAAVGGTWRYRHEFGWNVYEICFDHSPLIDGEVDDLAK